MVDVSTFNRSSPWDQVRVVVVGFDEAGAAACDNLLFLGAQIQTLTESLAVADTERVELLRTLGATIEEVSPDTDLPECDLVVLGARSVLAERFASQGAERGLPVWGELELAWRLRDPETVQPWLVVASSTDTAETVRMLTQVLHSAELPVRVGGASGGPIVEAVMDPEPAAWLVVECTPWQLQHVHNMSPHSSAVLSVADADVTSLASAYEQVQVACVYNLLDERTQDLVAQADVVEGARAVGITLGMPSISMLGLVEDILVDRAFIAQRHNSAAELCTVADLPDAEPHTVTAALAAAALARAAGVSQKAVRDGLRTLDS